MNCFAMFRGRRRFGIAASAALFLAAGAASAETYLTIESVPVDVTAKNAAAARDAAIAVAQSKAFDQLIKQVVGNPADLGRLHPSQEQIESFVQDFSVDSERVSTVRYIGLYAVRFKASLINKYLSESGVTPSNEQALQADTDAPGSAQASAAPQVTGPVTTYPIAVQIAGLTDWVRLRNQLQTAPGVRRLALDALTRDNAAVTLDFAGDPVALQAALSGTGYSLVQNGLGGNGQGGPGGLAQGAYQLQPSGMVHPAASAPQ